jgi:4-hydroxybenzoyl-CoA reductase subunit beta
MRLPKFECFFPGSVEEAAAFLSAHQGETCILAGGTDILVAMKQRRSNPKYLLNLKTIRDLAYIVYQKQDDVLRIGALTTLDAIAASPHVMEAAPALAQAAAKVGSPHLRNAGTIGGNICLDSRCWYYNQSQFWRSVRDGCFKTGGNRCYVVKGGKQCYSLVSSDTAPALIALGAEVELVSSRGRRVVSMESFYTGVGQTVNVMQEGEILTEIRVPKGQAKSGQVYLKHAYRESIDFPLVGIAVVLSMDSGDLAKEARICVGAASPAPIRPMAAESLLKGEKLSENLLEKIGSSAAKEVSPIVDLFASVPYKRRVIGLLVQSAIKEAVAAAESGPA